ncbi:MAG: integrase arm-type DNA-binding domain-containing protein, partial [Nitrospina sp.]|nr:integrase arm-type DNA-binding domain-containing protein [Nitrospina sp.]
MSLTNTAIKNAKPSEKPYKVFDERGLYLEVAPKGGKWWRFKYRFSGKEKRLSLGVYPDISLKVARDRREEARKLLTEGVDPSQKRKAQKATNAKFAGNSFEVLAREWFDQRSSSWSAGHASRIIRRLERDIFPWLGSQPIMEIDPPKLLSVIRRIEKRGALETAHRALGNCGQVFRYAIATSRAKNDPSVDLNGALPPSRGEHFASITEPKLVAEILRAIDGYEGTLTVRCALRLAPLVFVRPGELRKAKWDEVDLSVGEWRYFITKTDTQHIVPLSRQALQILKDLRPLTGNGPYVFPGIRSKERPMSDNAILAALRRMGIGKEEMTGHGFRAMARTILDEVL